MTPLMAILDGEQVATDVISPAKHRYIGMFRKPYVHPTGIVLCICGEALHLWSTCHDHWQRGHWDLPQYETIKPSQ